ncbi:MAG: phosphopantetheine-binding protein [Bacteroidota bacterium]
MNGTLAHKIAQLSEEQRKILLHKIKLVHTDEAPSGATKKITAYVQPKTNFELDLLKKYVKDRLPDYMVPTFFHIVEDIPLLPNGKVDKRALKRLPVAQETMDTEVVKPNSEVEEKLVSIWEEVLNFSPISIDDNFFEIGGDSILSIQIISKARKEGIMLAANQLFEYQTIKELSTYLLRQKEDKTKKYDYLTALRKEGTKTPLFCIHSGGGHVFFYQLLAKYLKPGRPIYAIEPTGLYENEKMHLDIREMTTDYLKVIRDIQPHGPYNVLVHCFSTSVGQEMALQLEGTNEEINIIVADNMASPWNAQSSDVFKVRLRSFFKRLFRSPIKTMKLFMLERAYLIEPIVVKIFGKDYEKELERLKANLRKMSLEYHGWDEKHQGQVSLLLTDKPDQNFQNLIINSWKGIAQGGVRVFPVKGEHTTLFEEPDVQHVSEKLDKCILE